jgi:hypothetical protein
MHPSPSHESLTLQFNNVVGFLTPVVTLLQGHPVPFVTTLVVLGVESICAVGRGGD